MLPAYSPLKRGLYRHRTAARRGTEILCQERSGTKEAADWLVAKAPRRVFQKFALGSIHYTLVANFASLYARAFMGLLPMFNP